MATTFSTLRMFPKGKAPHLIADPVIVGMSANAANQSIVPGFVMGNSSGLLQAYAAGALGAVATVVGIAEWSTPAVTPTSGDPMMVSLIMPHVVWEGTYLGVFAATDQIGNTPRAVTQTAGIGGLISSSGTNPHAYIMAALGLEGGYRVNEFIGKADTTKTAGQQMIAGATLGTIGDTNARVLFTWDSGALVVGQ